MGNMTKAFMNFSAGELSPKVQGRVDLTIFQNGCKRMRNFIAETQGGVRFRTGTRHVMHTRLNQLAVLIPFQFNDIQSYLLEFTDQKMRVYKDEGIIVEGDKTITGITQANPGVFTSASHGYSNGDEVFIFDVVGMTDFNGKSFLIANQTTNTFTLQDIDSNDIDTTSFDAYVSGGVAARIVEVDTPYLEAELFEIKWAQNADVMYMVHPNHEPRKLTRTSHTSWTLTTYTRTYSGSDPFGSAGNYPSTVAFAQSRLAMMGTDNAPETVWFSMSPDTSGNPRYDNFTIGTNPDDALAFTLAPNHTGKVDTIQWAVMTSLFIALGTFGGVSKMTGSRDDEPITPTSIQVKPLNAPGVKDVPPVTVGGITIYIQQGGLIIRSLEYDSLEAGYQAIDRNLVSDHMTGDGIEQIAFQNARPDVLWAVRSDGRLIGLTFKSKEDVSGWHQHVLGGTDAKVLSVGVIPQVTKYDQVWVVVERTINGVTRRYVEFFEDEINYPDRIDFFTDKDSAIDDRTAFYNAIFEKQKEYFHVDSGLSYVGTDRGEAAAANLTISAVTGDSITITASAAVFISADVGNQIWKKAINGIGQGRAVITTFVSSTEVTCTGLSDFDNIDLINSGDWFITASSISGLDHLEGEEVTIIADGGTHAKKTVSDGSITLDAEYSTFHIGLGYCGLIDKILEFGGDQGIQHSKMKNVSGLGIRFNGALGAQYGTDMYQLEQIYDRDPTHFMNRPPPLFSGVKLLYYNDSFARDKHLIIKQDNPLPCGIQLIDVFAEVVDE